MARLKWNGPEAKRRIEHEMSNRMAVACRLVMNHAKELLSVSGTGGTPGSKRNYGSNPSAPGEPPHKQYGRLRASVATEVEGMRGRVGTNVDYGRYLEQGTRKMAPRPWLKRSLDETKADIRRLFSRPMM
jgi:phage gpG-like protein